jgi:hypothetical protein
MIDIEYIPPVAENVETDYYLKFASEEEANNVLNPEVTTITTSYDEEGNAVDTVTTERSPLEGYSIDILGVLYDIVDEVAIPLEGWHVNLRGAMTDAFDLYKVEPVVPRRVFA